LAEADTEGIRYTPAAPLADGEHTVRVAIEDESGFPAEATWTFTVDVPEPGPVANLSASLQAGDGEEATVMLRWSPVDDADAYRIQQDGDVVDEVPAQTLDPLPASGLVQHELAAPSEGSATYRVVAVNAAGETGPASEPVETDDQQLEPAGETGAPDASEGLPWGYIFLGMLAAAAVAAPAYRHRDRLRERWSQVSSLVHGVFVADPSLPAAREQALTIIDETRERLEALRAAKDPSVLNDADERLASLEEAVRSAETVDEIETHLGVLEEEILEPLADHERTRGGNAEEGHQGS
jgi:hypothetical protein